MTTLLETFLSILQKSDASLVKINQQGVRYSPYYDDKKSLLTVAHLDLSHISISDKELESFSLIKHIKGSLSLIDNKNITHVHGLRNIETVSGELIISENTLYNIEGLDTLQKVDSLRLSKLQGITQINGITELSTLTGRLVICDNPALISINGLTSLSHVELEIMIANNPQLTKINGLNTVEKIATGSLKITNNPALSAINGFCSLTAIGNALMIEQCPALNSLGGLSIVTKVNNIKLEQLALSDTTALRNIFAKNNEFPGYVKIVSCGLADIHFMRGIKSVASSFYLHGNQLVDLQGLENLQSVGASFSLSANRLQHLRHLSKLTSIQGMLGLIGNQLTSLQGLEQLKQLKTVKWNGQYRTIAVWGNNQLNDISALSNITVTGKKMVLLMDQQQNFTTVPAKNSPFAASAISVTDKQQRLRFERKKVCEVANWQLFVDIAQCLIETNCHICRNQKYGYSWRQKLAEILTLPPGGVDFECPYGKTWNRFGYVSKSQTLAPPSPPTLATQLSFAKAHIDGIDSFPKRQWGHQVDVVYPYFAQEQDSSDELRYSLRSLTYLHEKTVNLWLVGDRPDWLNVDTVRYIPHQKTADDRYIDSRAKVKLAVEHPEMASHFLLMYDDIYLMTPMSTAFLGIPRYFADYTDALPRFTIHSDYHKHELKGFIELEKRGLPLRNYSLHWPYLHNSKNFLEMYKEYQLDKIGHNHETLYYNRYANTPIAYGGELLRINKVVTQAVKAEDIPSRILVLNTKVGAFKWVKSLLQKTFPAPSVFELPGR